MPNSLDVSAVIISYNSEDRIKDAIESHERALEHLDYEVIVVDNASADKSVEIARQTIQNGKVIANPENSGYGHAANLALADAEGRVTMILNDDVEFGSEMVDKLLAALDTDMRIGLIGPRIVDESGQPMPAAREDFPGLAEEWRLISNLSGPGRDNARYPTSQGLVDVAWVVGACVAGPTDLLREIGGFNPQFFLYGEDIDLAKRVKHLGYRVVTVPDATCVHTGSVSTTAAFTDEVRIRRRADARDIFYRLWYRKPTRMMINLRRAIGRHHQPLRLKYHLPKVLSDGGSLTAHRFPPPLKPSSD